MTAQATAARVIVVALAAACGPPAASSQGDGASTATDATNADRPADTREAGSDAVREAGPDAPPAVPTPPSPILQIEAGSEHICARLMSGAVYCWGSNQYGQLGDGDPAISRGRPGRVSMLDGVAFISGGGRHNCAIVAGGAVRCWGFNMRGQLGDGMTRSSPTPVTAADVGMARRLATSGTASCAILADNTVRCWDSTLSMMRNVPADTVDYRLGDQHACVRTAAGVVLCSGLNTSGQLGDGTTTARDASDWGAPIASLTSVVDVVPAGQSTCALDLAGDVFCWGVNERGQLGDGTMQARPAPTAVTGVSRIAQIAVGGRHACARTRAGEVWCWGDNAFGQIGDRTTIPRPMAVQVPGLSGVVEITAGLDFTCARLDDGTLQCWGTNLHRELGDGTQVSRMQPVTVLW